ncbi:MAG: hypothetical protein ACFE95_02430 [Candidatus Hodarchaeota archaeon]
MNKNSIDFSLRAIFINGQEIGWGYNAPKEGSRLKFKENSLIEFLQHIHYSYDQFEQYFKLLEVKFLNIRLKEHLELNKSKMN